MIPKANPLHSIPTIKKDSKVVLPLGDPSKSPEVVNQHQKQQIPTAEAMEQTQIEPQMSILTLTYEEFYQWRQVLGQYKKEIRATITS
jgi:hypothetical protein